MSTPKVLDPGRYAVTVPAPSDPQFTEWRMANKTRVGIREVRQTSGYQADDPNSIATYAIEVTAGPALPVPTIQGGGFDTLGKPGGPQSLDDFSPTSDPNYHANDVPEPPDPATIVKWSALALAGLVVLNAVVKKFLS